MPRQTQAQDEPHSPQEQRPGDGLQAFERVYLERLLLASRVILELGEDDAISDVLEVELTGFRESVERALLSVGSS